MDINVLVESLSVDVGDGVILNGDIYRPADSTPMPTILFRTPYGKGNVTGLFDPIIIARMGFAIFVQNVRGRYESDGMFDPFINEKPDGEATVRWLASQYWSDGRIFTFGVSYEGFAAMMCAENKKTVATASIASSSDIHGHWFFEGGAVRQSFVQAWAHSFAYTDKNRLNPDDKEYLQILANDLPSLYKPDLSDFPAGDYLPYYKSWINRQDCIYWPIVAEKTNRMNRIVHGYFLGGWYDIFCEGTISDYVKACEKSSKHQKLVIGPWSHTEFFTSLVGEIDFGSKNVSAYNAYDCFLWFSGLLDNAPSSGIKIFIMGKNKWVNMQAWPPPHTTMSLHLSSSASANGIYGDGRLALISPETLGCDCFVSTPNRFFPSRGGRTLDASTSAFGKPGPYDQRNLLYRDDILLYSTEKISSEITIAGLVRARLSVQCNYDTLVHVMLFDEMGDGRIINILDSCTGVAASKTPLTVCAELGHTAHTFLIGHRIGIVISSSRFPRLSLHNNLLCYNIKYSLHWGPGVLSCLELPVLGGGIDADLK